MKLFITVASLMLISSFANAAVNIPIILADPQLHKMIDLESGKGCEEDQWETPNQDTYSRICNNLNKAVIFSSFGNNRNEIRQNFIEFPGGVEKRCNTVTDKFLNFDSFAFVHANVFCCTLGKNSSVYIAKSLNHDYYLLFGSKKNPSAIDSDESSGTSKEFSEESESDSSYNTAGKNVYLQAAYIQNLTRKHVNLIPPKNPEGKSFSLYSPAGFEIYRFCAATFLIKKSISHEEGIVYTVKTDSKPGKELQRYSYSNCHIQKFKEDKITGSFKPTSRK